MRRLRLMIFLFAAISLTIAGVGVVSYRWAIYIGGTDDQTHHQFIATRGYFYWMRISHWWRAEDWRVSLDSKPSSDPIVTWPGMKIESHSRRLGFETATGKWKSPVVKVSPSDRILGKMTVPVGTMFSMLVPFRLVGIPAWAPLLVSLLVLTLLFYLQRRFRDKLPGNQLHSTLDLRK